MMRKICFGFLGTMLLMACNEAFPGLYAPVVDADNPHPEVVEDHLPIKVSVTDPAFNIVTRGLGAFEDWSYEDNRERWRMADFYVYAFLGKNREYTGNVDYSGEEVNLLVGNDDGRTPYCLVKNRKVRFNGSAEPTLEWVRENEGEDFQPYYSLSYPDYMFNFFIYHIDNAFCHGVNYRSDRVVYDISVDGTQDIISGYAHATKDDAEQLEDHDDGALYLLNHWKDLIYGTRAGNRYIHPRFFINHQMTRLTFSVKGKSKEYSDKIQVMSVGVYARFRGDFTVACDWGGGWSDEPDSEVPPLGIVWHEEKDTMFVATEQTPKDEFGAAFDQENCQFDPMITVDHDTESPLGGILLPPDDTYSIFIRYKMKDRPGEIFTASYKNVGFTDENKSFEAGKVYEVQLSIYGPQSIGLAVKGSGLSWSQGGDINVDKGEDLDF